MAPVKSSGPPSSNTNVFNTGLSSANSVTSIIRGTIPTIAKNVVGLGGRAVNWLNQKAKEKEQVDREEAASLGIPYEQYIATNMVMGYTGGASSESKKILIEGFETTEHAISRMITRGVSQKKVEEVIKLGERFKYFYDDIWKTGFYDPINKIFVATKDSQILTVIKDVIKQYIDKLQKK